MENVGSDFSKFSEDDMKEIFLLSSLMHEFFTSVFISR